MRDQEILSQRLVEVRKKNGYTRKRLAEELGRPYRTVTNYETGEHEPGHKYLVEIAKKFGVTVDYLVGRSDTPVTEAKKAPPISDEAIKIAVDYQGLDHWGRKVVLSVISDEKARIAAESARKDQAQEPEKVIYLTDWFPTMPMSAGTGQPAGSEEPEELRLVKRPPRGTSFIAPVSGDSMEPTYHDGDKLFIRICEEIEPRQIGVFYMDGQLWVKELGDGILISHNPAYAPRFMTEDVRCQGLVLGICDDSYLEA